MPIEIYWKFYHRKMKIFSLKKIWYFSYFAQNIDCGYSLEPPRWAGSNEYPQSVFLSRNKKNNVYPCKPPFYYIKVGFKGSKIYRHVFLMLILNEPCRYWYQQNVHLTFILKFILTSGPSCSKLNADVSWRILKYDKYIDIFGWTKGSLTS